VGGILWEESRVGGILVVGIPWEESRGRNSAWEESRWNRKILSNCRIIYQFSIYFVNLKFLTMVPEP